MAEGLTTRLPSCSNCGNPLTVRAKFCGKCGQPQAATDAPPSPAPVLTSAPEDFSAYTPPAPPPVLPSQQPGPAQQAAAPAVDPPPTTGPQQAPVKPIASYGGWALAVLFGLAALIFYFNQPPSHTVVVTKTVIAPTLVPAPTAMPVAAATAVPPPLAPPVQPVQWAPDFHEMDAVLDGRLSHWTSAQREAYWEHWAGSRVHWIGEVVDVETTSTGKITLRCNPETRTSDVHVSLDGSQIEALPRINMGQRVTIEGTLQRHDDYGYEIVQGRWVG